MSKSFIEIITDKSAEKAFTRLIEEKYAQGYDQLDGHSGTILEKEEPWFIEVEYQHTGSEESKKAFIMHLLLLDERFQDCDGPAACFSIAETADSELKQFIFVGWARD